MKARRTLLSLIATILLLPVLVSAKEYCTVVSGNGKDIGSEINCGGEHFYIIDSNDSNIRMLSKYNLNTGYVYDKIEVGKERYEELKETYCHPAYAPSLSLIKDAIQIDECARGLGWNTEDMKENEPEFANYQDYSLFKVQTDTYSFIVSKRIDNDEEIVVKVSAERFDEILNNFCGENIDECRYNIDYLYQQPEFENLDDVYDWNSDNKEFYVVRKVIKQDLRAIGAHGAKDNRDYPEYGVYENMFSFLDFNTRNNDEPYFDNRFLDMEPYDHAITINYSDYLHNNGYNIDKIDLLSVKDLDDVLYKKTGNHLPFDEWDENEHEVNISLQGATYYIVGSIKEVLPNDLSWLYSTTYWTKTVNNTESEYMHDSYVYFVDTLGDLCNADYCYTSVGAGIRPVITIGKDSIKYNITTETDNNGTIDVVEESNAGEEISFVLKSNEGYKLRSITLETESGIKVEFDQISETEDGRVIVNTNKFVMPAENVKIIANWEKEEEPVPEPEPEPTPSEPEEKEEIKEYNIKTIVDGDGSIDVIEKSVAGENIEFTIKALNGSKLVEFTVKDKDGNDVKYTKVSEDGDILVNKYTMPENDIVIRAKFETVVPVPKTGDNIMRYVTILMISFMVLVSLAFVARKNNN